MQKSADLERSQDATPQEDNHLLKPFFIFIKQLSTNLSLQPPSSPEFYVL